jgi:hypothetical protein
VNKKLLALAVNLLFLTCAAAYAQSIHVKATVPFSFTVGKATLPAGQYEVETTGGGRNILSIRNLNSKDAALVLSNTCETARVAEQTKLTFRRYGQHYFLAQVWLEGGSVGRQLSVGSREAEVARNFLKKDLTLVASRQ